MTDRLRLGVVGCGDIAGYMALFARLNRGLTLAACCDSSPEAAHRFAARFKIPHAYTDYHDLLAQPDLDAVYLAVPHFLHTEMLLAAIAAGRHVLVEKPITHDLDEARAVVQAADAAGVKVGVNYQYRYDSGCYALAMAARQGDLGELLYARGNLAWQRTPAYFEKGPWRGRLAQAGGGTLLTQGSHMLDILLWAMGSPPVSALGVTTRRRFKDVEVEDLAQGTLELASGALVQISSSMVATPEQALAFEVYGAAGTARYTDRPRPHVRFLGVRPRRARPPVGGLHALQRSLEAFRQWVVDGRPYLAPAAAALPVLAAVTALYRSAESGRKEPVPAVPC